MSTLSEPNPMLGVIVTMVVPLLMAGGLTDPALAAAAAREAIGAYRARGEPELLSAAQVLGFSVTALDSLRLSVGHGVSVNRKLRLRGNANGLNRSCQRANTMLAQQRGDPAYDPPISSEPGPEEARREAELLHALAETTGLIARAQANVAAERAREEQAREARAAPGETAPREQAGECAEAATSAEAAATSAASAELAAQCVTAAAEAAKHATDPAEPARTANPATAAANPVLESVNPGPTAASPAPTSAEPAKDPAQPETDPAQQADKSAEPPPASANPASSAAKSVPTSVEPAPVSAKPALTSVELAPECVAAATESANPARTSAEPALEAAKPVPASAHPARTSAEPMPASPKPVPTSAIPTPHPANPAPPRIPDLRPATTSDTDSRLAWAAAMSQVAQEFSAGLPGLSPSERRIEMLRIQALNDVARILAKPGKRRLKDAIQTPRR